MNRELVPVELGTGNQFRHWTAKRSLVPRDRSQPEPIMSLPGSVAGILIEHVTLEVEGICRM